MVTGAGAVAASRTPLVALVDAVGLLLGAAVAATLVVGGLVLLVVGLRRRATHEAVTPVEPTDAGRIDSTGPVEVRGTVVDDGCDLEAPIGGESAALVAWAVEELGQGGHYEGVEWTTLARGVRSEPFRVDDGTGTVEVALDDREHASTGLSVDWGQGATEGVRVDGLLVEVGSFPLVAEVGVEEDPPESVRDLRRSVGLPDQQSASLLEAAVEPAKREEYGSRRYRERTIAPGDEVYMRGAVETDPGAGSRRADGADGTGAADGGSSPDGPDDEDGTGEEGAVPTIVDPDEGPAIVSTLSAGRLESQYDERYRQPIAVGALSVVVGVALAVLVLS